MRKYASIKDQDLTCPVCCEYFNYGQSIFFGVHKEPVHNTRCKRKYRAALYIYYGVDDIVFMLSMEIYPRELFRVKKVAREVLGASI